MTSTCHRRRSAGFTLVEVVVSMGVASLLLGGMFASLESSQVILNHQLTVADLDIRLQRTLNDMGREVEGAGPSRLAAPAPGGTASAITFQSRVALNDPSGAKASDWGPTVTYTVQNSNLVRIENGQSRVIADRIASLTVVRDPARPRVTLRVTAFARNPESPETPLSASATAAVALRNP